VTDDTAYVQDFIDKGLPIPMGEYDCPGGLEFPGDYCDRARAAGREPDEPYADKGGFLLSEPPGAVIHHVGEHKSILCGWALPPHEPAPDGTTSGGISIGRNGIGMQYHDPVLIDSA
jgi:hypothetical protein